MTKVYNMVELCDYEDSKERIIRDVLIVSASTQAKDKIFRKGEKVTLKEELEILQIEDSTSKTLQNIDSTTKSAYYAHYDKKKSGSKGGKSKDSNGSSVNGTTQNSNSTDSTGKMYYRYKKLYSNEDEKSCPAKNAKFNHCGGT